MRLNTVATVGHGVRLEPFDDLASAGEAVRALQARPEAVAAWPGQELYCLGDSDGVGRIGWMRCSPEPWSSRDSTPSAGGRRYGTEREEIEVFYPLDDDTARLRGFALPGRVMDADAPWWAPVRGDPAVIEFLQRQNDVRVIGTWHYQNDVWEIVLRPTDETSPEQLRRRPDGRVEVEPRHRYRPPVIELPDGRKIPVDQVTDQDWQRIREGSKSE
jgi:hypothetical protein